MRVGGELTSGGKLERNILLALGILRAASCHRVAAPMETSRVVCCSEDAGRELSPDRPLRGNRRAWQTGIHMPVKESYERLDCGQLAFWNRWDSELHTRGRLLSGSKRKEREDMNFLKDAVTRLEHLLESPQVIE